MVAIAWIPGSADPAAARPLNFRDRRQVQQAFRTEIRKYAVNGVQHWANSAIRKFLGPSP